MRYRQTPWKQALWARVAMVLVLSVYIREAVAQ